MGGRTAIALGLAAGLLVGGVIVGGAIALVPAAPPVPPSATPAPAPSSTAPATEVPARTEGPSASPLASATAPVASPAPASEGPSASSPAEAFGIGEPAPPLVLPLVGGGTVDLADYRGKPVWVNFMATWCPSCVDELPSMALGGIGPDVMARGLETILPGVTVTP